MTNKSEILYVKGMNLSETDEEEEVEDIWDDRKLNDAYDKALRIANAEVAKRIAMSTNSNQKDASEPTPMRETSKSKRNKLSSKAKLQTNSKKTQWVPGMECRAVYDGDGLEYEAIVLRIINEHESIVRFLGYNNSDIVDMGTLKPSAGKEARDQQIQQALIDQADEEDSTNAEAMEIASDRLQNASPSTVIHSDKMSHKKKKSNKKKKTSSTIPQLNGFGMPSLPMPNASFLKNIGSMDMPIPPPMFPTGSRVDSDDQALQSMLLSWYMSGYYTGLYQGLRRWSDDLRKVAGDSWVRRAEDQSEWRALWEAYVQQWTNYGLVKGKPKTLKLGEGRVKK